MSIPEQDTDEDERDPAEDVSGRLPQIAAEFVRSIPAPVDLL